MKALRIVRAAARAARKRAEQARISRDRIGQSIAEACAAEADRIAEAITLWEERDEQAQDVP